MGFIEDIVDVKKNVFSKIKPFAPLIGFYITMLSPIYGIGYPFLGSMTDFTKLRNRNPPGVISNEYIVAPDGFTPARIDSSSPEFPVSATKLQRYISNTVKKQPRITYIASDEPTNRFEFVQRSLIFRFPDVITFQTIPLGSKSSTLAVHSYSIYGAGDLGVNRNRVETWLADLAEEVQKDNL